MGIHRLVLKRRLTTALLIFRSASVPVRQCLGRRYHPVVLELKPVSGKGCHRLNLLLLQIAQVCFEDIKTSVLDI